MTEIVRLPKKPKKKSLLLRFFEALSRLSGNPEKITMR